MKRILSTILSITLLSALLPLAVSAETSDSKTETISYNYSYDYITGYSDEDTKTREMEKLNRGLIAVKTNDGVYLSWRLLNSEDTVYGSSESNVSFDIYRDGKKIASESNTTNYTDLNGSANSKYAVVPQGVNPVSAVENIASDGSFTINAGSIGLTVYAVKYSGSKLESIRTFTSSKEGENTLHTDFVPDKVFLWNGLEPADGKISGEVSVLSNSYFDIPLVKPADETIDEGGTPAVKSFFPTDCSAGDLDGDGEYEIVVKWVSQEQDVGNGGYSGTVRFAAYKLDGTKLWDNDINLGKNVYSSAHTAQFLVYDFDGDGKAEMMVQTSLGSTDAKGEYVSHSAKANSVVVSTKQKIAEYTDEENASADFNGYDRKTSGEEFLTVFNGETGEAIDTIDLPTTRGASNGIQYGDDFGNRSNRFIASVAYLDGVKPYAVYMRGYYFGRNGRQRTSIAGVSFDGERLSPDYRFDTQKNQPGYYEGAYQYVGQGNHNCTVADVDNDGKDEFITGALCMEVNDENQFRPRWCTYLQHGDALHIGDYDPTHNGLEFFTVHEDEGTNTLSGTDVTMDFGMSVIDADTGEIMFHVPNTKDTGRGVMANTGSGGYYQITGVGSYQCNGGTDFTPTWNGAGSNFRIFWDGDLYDELLDGVRLTNWNSSQQSMVREVLPTNGSFTAVNGTKANPSLQADLFGDWREELIYPTNDGNNLRVFTTTTPTDYKIKTLMHDPVYRSGIAAEQTAYNQPPHVGFYLADEVFTKSAVSVDSIAVTHEPDTTAYLLGEQLNTAGLIVSAVLSDGNTVELPSYEISGYDPNTAGEQTVTVSSHGQTAEFKVSVFEADRIEVDSHPDKISKGQTIDKNNVKVRIYYGNDGAYKVINDFELECNSDELGTQVVTVRYGDLTDTFNVEVVESQVVALNGIYETNSTQSVLREINIGDHSGNFTFKHTFTVNSLPAGGNQDKNNTDGLFVRFMPQKTGDKNGVGAGWYITGTDDSTKYNVYWKSDARQATLIADNLTVGTPYTFLYSFNNVGTGSGANVEMNITTGDTAFSKTGLSLRNMTSSDIHKSLPLSYIQVYNQAQPDSTASVTISGAEITEH